MEIEQIKQAKILHSRGETFKNIEESIGISRTVLPHLLELYDLFESRNVVEDKNGEYVRVKKKRYLLQKIKLQHKIADIRKEYIKQLQVLSNKRKKIRLFLDKQESYEDIKEELSQKQKMLEVTSSNLHHAEDGYEYLKREVNYNKAIYFIYGIGFIFVAASIFNTFLGHITISF